MLRLVRFSCVCVVLFFAMVAHAVAGDVFPGTTLTGSSGSIVGTTVGATPDTGEPASIGGGTINSMWYTWTATATGTFSAGTCNLTAETVTNHDTVLGAFTGAAVNALTQLVQNDDTTGCNSTVNANYGSWVSFNVTAGTTYRLRVDGYASNTGGYTLRWGLNAVTVNVTDGSATEGGDTAVFTVRPASPPQGSTAVVMTIGTSGQCTFATTPATLSFTSANFTTPQTVTVTATNDLVAEGTHSCSPASITTTNYGGVNGTPPTITVYDNDNPSFTIAKSASPATISAPGTVTYTITVDNNGSAILTGTTITDALTLNGSPIALTSGPTLTSGDVNSNNILEDTETWIYTATYSVTQANIDGVGNLANTATFDTAETAPQTSNSAATTITRTPALSLDKTYVITTDGGGAGVADLGDVITYTYAVTNSGNVTINGVSVSDVHSGAGSLSAITPASVASLAPGATANFTATYTAVQTDIDNQ